MAQIRSSINYFGGLSFRLTDGLRVSIWPFTSPLTDLLFCIYLMPVFWLLGLEQIIPFAIILLAGLKMILLRKSIRLPLPGAILVLFLLWQFVSFLSIDVVSNRIVFLKNWLTYLVGLTIFIILVNEVRTKRDLSRVMNSVFWLMIAASFIGILFIAGLVPGRFESLAGRFLPDFLKQSTFIQENVIQREIGIENAYIGNFQFRRVTSIFLFPGSASLGYLVAIPLLIYAWFRAPVASLKYFSLLFILPFILLVFLSTGTRTAILLFPASILVVLLIYWLRRVPKLSLPVVLIGLMIIAVIILILTGAILRDFLNLVFVEVRGSSIIDRMEVYQATFDSLRGKLVTGWGSPREIETVQLAPAGTHGEYIFVLYSYGLIGLFLYLAFLASIWIRFIRNAAMSRRQENRINYYLYIALAIILLTITIRGITHGTNFDLTGAILFWLVVGLAWINWNAIENGPEYVG